MGVVCGVGFMGAPVILIEKLVGGDETMLAYQRLQQLMASGLMSQQGGGGAEGKATQGNQVVKVLEKKCYYFDGSSFPIYLASEEDLKKVSLENIPLVCVVCVCVCVGGGGGGKIALSQADRGQLFLDTKRLCRDGPKI